MLGIRMLGIHQADAGMPDTGIYFQWGDFLIQFGNLVVIATMVVLFILALVIPFPHGRKRK
ncbi:large-conductance mechanosensitive channel [Arthrobacter bambusae]|jgi:large-conductance mechanosensitive channel|nr:large-conductance mechanosensitive channel [Arthrobacter bambusae]